MRLGGAEGAVENKINNLTMLTVCAVMLQSIQGSTKIFFTYVILRHLHVIVYTIMISIVHLTPSSRPIALSLVPIDMGKIY